MMTLAIAASLAKNCAVAADFPARAVTVATVAAAAAAAAAAATGTTADHAAVSTEFCELLVDADFRDLDLGLAAPSYLAPAAAVAAEAAAAYVLLRRATIHMCHNLVLQCQNHLRYQTADSTLVQHCRRIPVLFSPPGALMCN